MCSSQFVGLRNLPTQSTLLGARNFTNYSHSNRETCTCAIKLVTRPLIKQALQVRTIIQSEPKYGHHHTAYANTLSPSHRMWSQSQQHSIIIIIFIYALFIAM